MDVTIQTEYTNLAVGFAERFVGRVSGRANLSVWDFGDGTLLTNVPNVLLSWAAGGTYTLAFTAFNDSYPAGRSTTITVHVISGPVHYVSVDGTNPVAPYVSWNTAATNIQDAVDAAFAGSTVLVSNGVYRAGGKVTFGLLTNRVAIDKVVTVQSINGAAATVIQGNGVAGDNAARCVYLANNATIIGFTLAGGATRIAGEIFKEQSAGGVWCESTNCVLRDCAINSNTAAQHAGGAYSGSFSNCVLGANKASGSGGGAFGSILRNCTVALNTNSVFGAGLYGCIGSGCLVCSNNNDGFYGQGGGGGAYNSSMTNCAIASNTARYGAGACSCFLSNCTVSGNLAVGYLGGGGAYQSTLKNCIVIGNRATSTPSAAGGGYGCVFNSCLICSNSSSGVTGTSNSTLTNCTVVGHTNGYATYASTLRNCIAYFNANNCYNDSVAYTCTFPLVSGPGNFTNPPSLVDVAAGNCRLQTNSPCINSGANAYAVGSADLDGRVRVVSGTVDMGAYEFQGAGLAEFIQWMRRHGLPTDGSADTNDSDGDGVNNWQEWVAGTDPTNPASAMILSSPVIGAYGLSLIWQSASDRLYFLERSTNLAGNPAFTLLATNIIGTPDVTTYTDATAVGLGPFFYRVGLQGPPCYVQTPFSTVSFAWLQRYGLPADGSADFFDSDGDGMNNWQEWIAGTDPTNALSVLKMQPPSNSSTGITINWQSVSGNMYYLQRANSLQMQPGFSSIRSNITGQAGTTSFTDTTATNSMAYFYRVGVQQ